MGDRSEKCFDSRLAAATRRWFYGQRHGEEWSWSEDGW